MIDNHLARRSVSDFQRGVLALRKKEIVAARAPQQADAAAAETEEAAPRRRRRPRPPWSTREDVAGRRGCRPIPSARSSGSRRRRRRSWWTRCAAGPFRSAPRPTSPRCRRKPRWRRWRAGARSCSRPRARCASRRPAAKPKKEAAPESPEDQVKALRAQVGELKDRVATLMTENEVLRQKLATLGA